MKQQLFKKAISCVAVVITFMTCFTGTAMANKDIKPSTVNYYVEMNDDADIFVGNKKTIGSEVGTEYYMTYTVEKVDIKETRQQGVIGTNAPTTAYPYDNEQGGGLLLFNSDTSNKMLIEGNTYFLKFTITEDGYEYSVGRAKDEKSRYIEFDLSYGKVTTGLGYFGIWLGDLGISGRLIKVRTYDRLGNDLGVQVTASTPNAYAASETPLQKDTEVNHSYTLKLNGCGDVAISNMKKPTSNKVYMEYKVKSSDSKVCQAGVILSNSPKATYPYLSGQLIFNEYTYDASQADDGEMLVEGAEYLIVLEKKEDKLDVIVQQTLNGNITQIKYALVYGDFNLESNYYSLWLGGSGDFYVNAELVDFKCYDSNKNNLGVQCNNSGCEIIHYGEMEDYSGCEAMYYCEEDASLYALYADQSLKYSENGTTKEGTYSIEDSVLMVDIDNENRKYDFLYQYFTGEGEKVYNRLHTYKVVFETGEGSKVESQILNTDNGYMPMRPTDPVLDGNIFEGWYTAAGEEYKFDCISTESITLYAQWGHLDYVDANVASDFEYVPYVAMGISILIFVTAIVCGRMIIIRSRKNGSSN